MNRPGAAFRLTTVRVLFLLVARFAEVEGFWVDTSSS